MTKLEVLGATYVGARQWLDDQPPTIKDIQGIIGHINCPTGWAICCRIGTEPPPDGSILIGGLVLTQAYDEPDRNFFVYPDSIAAMIQQRHSA